MLAYILLFFSINIFGLFFIILGKEWYAPYSLYCVPFIILIFIGSLNQSLWDYTINETTFATFLFNFFFFCTGCMIAKMINRKSCNRLFFIAKDEIIISNKKLRFILCIAIITFIYYYLSIYMWGKSNSRNFISAMNYIMSMAKARPELETMHKSIILKFMIVFVEILPFIISYWIARVLIFKDRINLKLLLAIFVVCEGCLFLTGSRGPMVEPVIALIVAYAIMYYSKTHSKIFKFKTILKVALLVLIVAIGFFAVLPMMGRQQVADNMIDSVFQYIGAQIYNFNYFTVHNDSHSVGFLAHTLSSLYDDIKSFLGLDLTNHFQKVSISYISTSNGHSMGNVYSCLIAYYIDAGILGVCLCSFFSGYVSEAIYINVRKKGLNSISFPIYLYMAINLVFCFFASRFYSNIINIKFFIRVFYIICVYMYATNSRISRRFSLKL